MYYVVGDSKSNITKQINNGHSKFMKRGFAFPRFSFEGKSTTILSKAKVRIYIVEF